MLVKDEVLRMLLSGDGIRRYFVQFFEELGKRTGNVKVSSPFREDKDPSFSIDLSHGLWHDFATGESGDIFAFEQRMSECDFKTALNNLHKFAGGMPSGYNKVVRRVTLGASKTISKIAVETWSAFLFSESAIHAKTYLNQRGLNDETLRKYCIGYDSQTRAVTIPLKWDNGDCFALKRFHFEGTGWKKQNGKKIVSTVGPSVLYCAELILEAVQLIVCEGELDCLILRQHGFDAITGTAGAGSWKVEWNESLRGREVILLFDSDEMGRGGAEKLATRLASVASEVRIGELFSETETSAQNKDVTDFFLSGHDDHDLTNVIKRARECSDKSESNQGVKSDGIDRGLNLSIIAKQIQHNNELVYAAGDFFTYASGVWSKDETRTVERIIRRTLEDKATKGRIESIRYLLSIDVQLHPNKMNANTLLLNLVNGMFDLQLLKLIPHSPDHLSSIQLSFKYESDAGCKRWEQFLDEVFGNDESLKQLLQEVIGYILIPDTSMQKMFWLIGEGANGKGVVLKVLEALIDRTNRTNLDVRNITNPFVRAAMYNKILSLNGDFPKKFHGNEDILKMIVGGDTIDAQEKFKPQFEFIPTCRFVFAMNSLPKTNDKSHGFFRRVVLIPFQRIFRENEQDRNLIDALKDELPGIFNWALQGLKRIAERQSFTESQAASQLLANYKKENDSVGMFLESCCVINNDAKVKVAILWEEYEAFCAESGIEPLSKRDRAMIIRDSMPIGVKTHRWGTGEPPQRTYFGIGLLESRTARRI